MGYIGAGAAPQIPEAAANSVATEDIQNNAVTPVKLSTGAPAWDSSGNVGIGTSSPSHQLDVINGARANYVQIKNGGYAGSGATTPELYSPAAATLVIAAGGAERMRIDSSGRVTMPYQPSFHVRVNNYAWIQTSPIPWSQAVYDVGSNFNLSTYRFTAPIAGKYFFIAQVLCHSQTSEYAAIFLRKNGSNVTYSEVANSTVNNNNTKHITAVLDLSANDYIDFAFDASGGDYYGGNQETNLYGWLLG